MLRSLPSPSRSAFALAFGLCVATTTTAFAKSDGDDNAEAGKTDTTPSEADASAGEPTATEGSDTDRTESPAPVEPKRAKDTNATSKDTSHKGQFSLRLAGVGAYRIVMRYDNSPMCAAQRGNEPQKFCGFGAPMALESAIGYAPMAGVEPFLWGRFGLGRETQTQTAPLVVLGAGVRLYTMSDAPFKFFIEPAIGAEIEKRASGGTDPGSYAQDWLIRLAVGPQYDFNRYIGLYATGAMTVGMVRALHTFMELHGGLQARFP
jgi:hypothetical protein